eukprot:jgi/Galph1/1880/GphlegSOOS_G576.1
MSNPSSEEENTDKEELFSLEDLMSVEITIPIKPKDYAKPFFYGGLCLFTAGLAAGAVVSSRTTPPEEKKADVLAARAEGFRLASKALLYGTCLCGVFGAIGIYSIHRFCNVNSTEEFVDKLRIWVPQKRQSMESTFQPILNSIRETGTNTVTHHFERWQSSFRTSKSGQWFREKTSTSEQVTNETSSANDTTR